VAGGGVTQRIVVGVDGSAHGNAALRWAMAEAEVHRGEVTAVFAWQMPFLDIPGAFDRQEIEDLSKQFLVQTVAAVVPDPQVPLNLLVAQGDVSEALIHAAKDADLLVLGSRGRGGFVGLKLGSVSQECVAHADCPVVVVRSRSGRGGAADGD
jgi:nucleotide-binding universal stress UspA family protein